MISIYTIEDLAAQRHGGHEALSRCLSRPLIDTQIAQPNDTRWLSEMSRMIFQEGFNWRVIDNKWPDFEQAFDGFDLLGCAHVSDEVLEQKNAGIIDGPLKSRRAWQQVQEALDYWRQKSGYSLTEISQILGLSFGQINDRLP